MLTEVQISLNVPGLRCWEMIARRDRTRVPVTHHRCLQRNAMSATKLRAANSSLARSIKMLWGIRLNAGAFTGNQNKLLGRRKLVIVCLVQSLVFLFVCLGSVGHNGHSLCRLDSPSAGCMAVALVLSRAASENPLATMYV